ncbi:TPR-like protein [Mycena rebaudengoi]|nr:TPR-like protein [Mycena rebaudengoi]
MRHSKSRGTRLLGSAEVTRSEALASVEQQTPRCPELTKVNHDGPSLSFKVDFSLTESVTSEEDTVNAIAVGEDKFSFLDSLDSRTIKTRLLKLHGEPQEGIRPHSPQLAVIYESILLLSAGHGDRGLMLHVLGDLCLKRWETGQMMDDLNLAVCIYRDAVRDDPLNITVLSELGIALYHRFEHLSDLADLAECISTQKDALGGTTGEHPDRGSRLSNLGNSYFARFQRLADVTDLHTSVSMHKEAVDLTSNGTPEKLSMSINLGNSLFARFEQLGNLDDLDESLSIKQNAVCLMPDDHPQRPIMLVNLGDCLLTRFERFGELVDINQSVSVKENAVRLTPEGHSAKPSRLDTLGKSLLSRFRRLNDLSDLEKSVSLRQDAVHLTPDGDRAKPTRLNNLGNSLLARFQRLGDLSDINESVSVKRDAVRLTAEMNPDRPSMLTSLGNTLRNRFDRLGDLTDLNESVSLQEDAVRLASDEHPQKPVMLTNLGNSLLTRFQRLGDVSDLDEALSMMEIAVRMTQDGHPNKRSILGNMSNSLLARFRIRGDLSDLDKAISVKEDVISLTPDGHTDRPSMLSNLATSLRIRFEQWGDLNDLNRCLSLQKDALRVTLDGHPDRPSMLNNLGNSLQYRYEELGDLNDLNESVSLQKDAMHLTPDEHPQKAYMLANLGNCLHTRFKQLGALGDLNESVSMKENSISLMPEGHFDKPSMLTSLGNSLRSRFDLLGDLSDLNESVVVTGDAVRSTPDGHPEKPARLTNLSNSLFDRFTRAGKLADLKESVAMAEDALHLTPDGHLDKPTILSNLGHYLLIRFRHFSELPDLIRSVSMQNDAVRLTPDDNPSKPFMLTNLGNSLLVRFEQLGDLADLDRSVSLQKDAIHLRPDGHPVNPTMRNNLSNAYLARFERRGDPDDIEQAIHHFTCAARSTTGPARIRFHSASMWAQLARVEQHPSLLDAYRVAIDLLPELAWLGLSITDRHHHVLEAGSLVRDAAAAALSSGQPVTAVEWLEQGRSIIWGQVFSLRNPIDALKEKHPVLADELIALSARLETAGTRGSDGVIRDSGGQGSPQSIAQQSHKNALERAELLENIRRLEGFQRFLLPKTLSELSAASQKGPVVFLNLSSASCDALVLLPGLVNEVTHVRIPDFTPADGSTLADCLQHIVPDTGRNERLSGHRKGSCRLPEDEFARILSELWTPKKDAPLRIWWCPTGPLTFLPIHAAGLYGKDDTFGSKLADFVISSYAPFLDALIEGRQSKSTSHENPQLLAVAQPSASGQTYIPGTQEEINHIEIHASGKLPILRLEEELATVESVEKGIIASSWVHFACHGIQNVSDPIQSALLLAGSERLTLSRIINLSLPHARFAFLSACQTATGNQKLQEESVHLAAGMLLAGYRGVIATMWTIMDNDAPQVADDVYAHIFKVSPADSSRAAEALHLAVRKLREEGGRKRAFSHWVPFIHLGV